MAMLAKGGGEGLELNQGMRGVLFIICAMVQLNCNHCYTLHCSRMYTVLCTQLYSVHVHCTVYSSFFQCPRSNTVEKQVISAVLQQVSSRLRLNGI